MRVLHVIPSLSASSGGPSIALPAMARSLAVQGLQIDVVTTDDDGPGLRTSSIFEGGMTARDGYQVFYFSKQTEFYKASLPLLVWLIRHVHEYDIVHVHAVFSFSSLAASWACRLHRVPYIVRPLGVLNRWGMTNRRPRLKALSFKIFDRPALDHAAALHFTSEDERVDASRLHLLPPEYVIPLGFDLAAFDSLPAAEIFLDAFPDAAGREIVLYLSRLDPKKNLEVLIEAFALLPHGPLLVIAGDGDLEYVGRLKMHAQKLGLAGNVLWTGHLNGPLKMAAFAASSLYVLPSRTENFGIALLEAMAAGLACLSTPGVALAAEIAATGAVALSIGEAQPLSSSIRQLINDVDMRKKLGARAAAVVRERYSSTIASSRLKNMYELSVSQASSLRSLL